MVILALFMLLLTRGLDIKVFRIDLCLNIADLVASLMFLLLGLELKNSLTSSYVESTIMGETCNSPVV